jgi:phosphoribosylaminoimidazole-succinocarboxamide synthase
MGSVKDLKIIEEPKGGEPGVAQFVFSDRYSVFDWGEMPDLIREKGKALSLIGAHFFERLSDMKIPTHYLGIVEDEKTKSLSELKKPSNIMQIKLIRVIKPAFRGKSYDYSVYKREAENFLIPLEIIYRNSLPEGSSVFRRIERGELKLSDLGLEEMPEPGERLKYAILDISTKLEATDRYIGLEEARELAYLKKEEMDGIRRITLTVNRLITEEVEPIGLVNEDGKVEFGFDRERALMLVDVLGTPDECRFTFDRLPVSKEIARIYYRNTEWYNKVEAAKKEDRVRWKELVDEAPPPLPERLSELISLMYQACANEITKKEWFDAPSLKEILKEMRSFEFLGK